MPAEGSHQSVFFCDIPLEEKKNRNNEQRVHIEEEEDEEEEDDEEEGYEEVEEDGKGEGGKDDNGAGDEEEDDDEKDYEHNPKHLKKGTSEYHKKKQKHHHDKMKKKKHQSEYQAKDKKKKRMPPASVRFNEPPPSPPSSNPHPSPPPSSPPSPTSYSSPDSMMSDDEIYIPRRITRAEGRKTYRQRNPEYPRLTTQPSEKEIPLQYRFTTNFLGYTPKEYTNQPNIPNGYQVRHTRNGYVFLVPEADEVETPTKRIWSAKFEHKRIDIDFSASREEMGDVYGVGMYIFFDFLRYLTWANLILFFVQMIHFLAHIYLDGFDHYSKGWYWLYIGDYSKKSYHFWLYGTIAAVITWFIMGPLYTKRVTKYYINNQIEDFDDGFRFDDAILSNERYRHRGLRLVISYIVFALCVAGAAGLTYLVCKIQTGNTEVPSLVASAVVAVFISAVNLAYNFFAVIMTKFERHTSWSSFRAHNTFKFYMFKVLLAVSMYISRKHFINNVASGGSGSESSSEECEIRVGAIADQFLLLLVVDLLWGNLVDVAYVWVLWRYSKMQGETSRRSNEAAKPEFDVAEQYLQLLYRQFIIFLGSTIFPWLPLLGVLCHFVDYYVSKYILIRFCQQNYYLRGSMKKFLTFYLFFSALMAVVCFPFGAAWVLAGYSFKGKHCFH